MVRVISGTAGGLKLQTLDSDSTKPTLDRVKEAMFSMVREAVYSASVLDLFSGNGALGIEALSRGAESCFFNDKNRQCCDIIKKNLLHTKLDGKAEVSCADYTQALSSCKKRGLSFGLVLLDPPYGNGFEKDALSLISKFGLATPYCTAVCEHSASESMPGEIGSFRLIKTKIYGTVGVSVFENEV